MVVFKRLMVYALDTDNGGAGGILVGIDENTGIFNTDGVEG